MYILYNDDIPRDQMYEYCQDKLMSRVTNEFRNETFDTNFFPELGQLGILGPTIKGYGCAGTTSVAYGLITREIERVGHEFVFIVCVIIPYKGKLAFLWPQME